MEIGRQRLGNGNGLGIVVTLEGLLVLGATADPDILRLRQLPLPGEVVQLVERVHTDLFRRPPYSSNSVRHPDDDDDDDPLPPLGQTSCSTIWPTSLTL